MKATELRIGNFIKVKTSNDAGIYVVGGIDGWKRIFKTKEDEAIYKADFDENKLPKRPAEFSDERIVRIWGGARNNEQFIESKLKPVPLTEDWLNKFGFQKCQYPLNEWDYKIEGLYLTFQFEKNLINLYLFDDEAGHKTYLKDVKYVHQLQNLFFALTGEELTIKT